MDQLIDVEVNLITPFLVSSDNDPMGIPLKDELDLAWIAMRRAGSFWQRARSTGDHTWHLRRPSSWTLTWKARDEIRTNHGCCEGRTSRLLPRGNVLAVRCVPVNLPRGHGIPTHPKEKKKHKKRETSIITSPAWRPKRRVTSARGLKR